MEYKYIYFDTNGPIFYLFDLDQLKEYYYKTLNKDYLDNIDDIDRVFYNNMIDDGYFIIQLMETNIIYFFIELDKLEHIYNDLTEEKEIIEIIKNKLN